MQIRLSVSKMLCLNLCSLKWLRPTQTWERKISSFRWLTLKTSLLQGLIKFKIFFLKVEYGGVLRISKSKLFHSTNTDKKRNKEKVIPYFKLGNHQVLTIFFWYELLFEGIKLNKYFGECSFTIL